MSIHPSMAAQVIEGLQPIVDKFLARKDEVGYVRLDMPLLKVHGDRDSGIIEDSLVSHFRAITKKLQPSLEFARVPEVLAFIRATLPGLKLPAKGDIRFIPLKARTVVRDGVEVPLKATVGCYYGQPPSSLSPQAKESNDRLDSKWGAILGSTTAATAAEVEAELAGNDDIPF